VLQTTVSLLPEFALLFCASGSWSSRSFWLRTLNTAAEAAAQLAQVPQLEGTCNFFRAL
jgi:hypothetical protein